VTSRVPIRARLALAFAIIAALVLGTAAALLYVRLRAAVDGPGGLQVVGGLSLPVGAGPSRGERGVFLYLSFEHPAFGAGGG